jgi:hypothetical protein
MTTLARGCVRLTALAAAIAAGCGSGSDAPDDPAPVPKRSANERLVRAWSAALARDDFRAAASLFARGALIQQSRTFRLRTRRAALAFNLSLPCRGRVTRVKDEEGETAVAAFRLAPRRGVPPEACDDVVRVRFRSRGGKFVEWRQLPRPATPPGQAA